MKDPIEYVSPRQRHALLVLLMLYIGTFLLALVTNSQAASAATDLIFAVVFVPGSLYAIARFKDEGVESTLPYVVAGATGVAGLAIGYSGLAKIASLPHSRAIDGLGTLALLVALIAYFYWRR